MEIPGWLDQEAYPFAHRFARLRAGAMHYVDEGEGEPLLLVHGTPTWSFEYRHLIRGLSPRFRCVAPDHLGFGLSERPAGLAYTPEAHASNLRDFVSAVGLDDFTLVVHDFGGPIALPLLFDPPPRVKRLVVLNSWCWPVDDPGMRRAAKLVRSALGRFLYTRFNASVRLVAPAAWGDRRKLTPAIQRQYLAPFPDPDSRGRVLWALARALLDSEAHYRSLWEQRGKLARVPVLIVWGMKDPAFKPHLLERWREAAPHARVVPLPDAGHWPHEEAPEAVLDALRAFLETPAREEGLSEGA